MTRITIKKGEIIKRRIDVSRRKNIKSLGQRMMQKKKKSKVYKYV
jgi:hypothetical protein